MLIIVTALVLYYYLIEIITILSNFAEGNSVDDIIYDFNITYKNVCIEFAKLSRATKDKSKARVKSNIH